MASIVVTGRSERITSREKTHAEEKIQKLERYFNGITRIEIVLNQNAELAEAELVISVKKGSQIVCRTQDKDLYAAIDLVLDKAEILLTRHKEKVRQHQHHRGREGGGEGGPTGESGRPPEPGEETLEAYEDIVEKREFPEGGAAAKQ